MKRAGGPDLTAYEQAEQQIPRSRTAAALAGARPEPFWLDDPARPDPLPALAADTATDLAVVGGGYSGLWTALMAKERDPGRRVVLLEGRRIGWAASGRNGGFCEASLTHGDANGQKHLPQEAARLRELGQENLEQLAAAVARYGIDCGFEWTGTLSVATAEHQVQWLRDEEGQDPDIVFLDQEAVRKEVGSPLFRAGLWDRKGTAMLNPARLAWGLQRACLAAGVEIFEHTPVRGLRNSGSAVELRTDGGTVTAEQVALATNVFPSLLRRTRLHTVPVYDYALMTGPLGAEQLRAIGWHNRQGLADLDNRFHYYRLATDPDGGTRILFGGYDAVYHYGRRLRPEYEQREATFTRLAAHFFATFPQLEDAKFTHQWGGAIDTCSRFFPFFSTAHGGRVAFAAGYTGLGVGATRFGANVMLDLLAGTPTERTELAMVRRKPLPFPPEPLAWLGIKTTTAALIRADRNQGRRGPWLKAMDAVGMGFDS
ncbi:FAD-dependent oxidoreductase [Arthrobacter crystallopoietes BAB-32]|uniref:FAD-dependent oxidoreductase n=1 Tax=Arthrobacter crystallopoietes BAB-32 TaxID=1246476 RepID=N1UYN7_9MICC|nr:FAD-dependent oxidoreductase [Arthrobacter crystallopoietes]EMY32889.1 FAD-dependent oxidoreductase [Arthrobacter crystallopoietes BAB-32]